MTTGNVMSISEGWIRAMHSMIDRFPKNLLVRLSDGQTIETNFRPVVACNENLERIIYRERQARPGQPVELDLSAYPAPAVRILFDYLVCGALPSRLAIDHETFELAELADMYGVSELTRRIEDDLNRQSNGGADSLRLIQLHAAYSSNLNLSAYEDVAITLAGRNCYIPSQCPLHYLTCRSSAPDPCTPSCRCCICATKFDPAEFDKLTPEVQLALFRMSRPGLARHQAEPVPDDTTPWHL